MNNTKLYPQQYPQVGDYAMVKVTAINEDTVTVYLLEYDVDGLVNSKQLAKKAVKNIRKCVRIGSQECMEVINVDKEKGYIDLTRKHITKEDKKRCMEKYNLAKRLYKFFTKWSIKHEVNYIENILWPLYDSEDGQGYSGVLESREEWLCNVAEDIATDFNRMFAKKPIKYQLMFELACYSPSGVTAIQDAIDKGLAWGAKENKLQCIYTGKTGSFGTIFELSTMSVEDSAMEWLKEVVRVIEACLEGYDSQLVIMTE